MERKALHEHMHNEHIIKPADKGGAIVLMDHLQYKNEILRQLSDTTVNRKVDYDPKNYIFKTRKLLTDHAFALDVIDKEQHKFLLPSDTKTPVLYTLPQIHIDLQIPPGRPIVSGRGSILSPAAIFLDKVLRTFAISAS